MKKTVGILAHVDAGKTTFSEQLLYHTQTIKTLGRVDHKNSYLDTHSIEMERGITIFADQAMFRYKDSTYYLIDTPGHVDFAPEMERSIQVMDYAILIISAADGVEGHTETVWDLLKKHQIPTYIFINKIDREGVNVREIMTDIQTNLTENVVLLDESFQNGSMSEELIEQIAEQDEQLLERYLQDGYEPELWIEGLQNLFQANQLYPCSTGSALHNKGIEQFLERFHVLTATNYSTDGEFTGKVYKIRYDDNGTRWIYIKALSGSLKVRDPITYGDKTEKVTQIRKYNGQQPELVSEIEAGELFAVTGLTTAQIGDGIGGRIEKEDFTLIPTLRSKVVFNSDVNPKEALRYFQILDEEDPSLHVEWNEMLQEVHLHIMGTVQLEVLQQMMKERFQLNVTFESPEILYKETIQSDVIGYGHFEPLRHYAEVHLKIEPLERNSGVQFQSECHPNHLPVGIQNNIEQYVLEREHRGILTGSPITDIKVTLLTGRNHEKHTHGGDFREATIRALRQGLEKANNILLEPYYKFKIKVDIDQMGKVLTDIQAANGQYDPPLTIGDKGIITGKAPVATFMDYSTVLVAYTHGRGSISLEYAGYDVCHNPEEVMEKIGYDKDADSEYTSSSVFCKHGKGYSVPWHEAEELMHCLRSK